MICISWVMCNLWLFKWSHLPTGKQLLEVASKIDPGFSKLRGDLLFELQSASVLLAQRALAEDRVTPFQV